MGKVRVAREDGARRSQRTSAQRRAFIGGQTAAGAELAGGHGGTGLAAGGRRHSRQLASARLSPGPRHSGKPCMRISPSCHPTCIYGSPIQSRPSFGSCNLRHQLPSRPHRRRRPPRPRPHPHPPLHPHFLSYPIAVIHPAQRSVSSVSVPQSVSLVAFWNHSSFTFIRDPFPISPLLVRHSSLVWPGSCVSVPLATIRNGSSKAKASSNTHCIESDRGLVRTPQVQHTFPFTSTPFEDSGTLNLCVFPPPSLELSSTRCARSLFDLAMR